MEEEKRVRDRDLGGREEFPPPPPKFTVLQRDLYTTRTEQQKNKKNVKQKYKERTMEKDDWR